MMMTRTLLTTLAALLLPAVAQAAPPGDFGIGVGGGLGVSGLSMKAPFGPVAVQGVVGTYGWNGYYDDDRLGVSVDLLWSQPEFASGGPVNLAWNIGFGGAVGVGRNDPLVGISGVAGLSSSCSPRPSTSCWSTARGSSSRRAQTWSWSTSRGTSATTSRRGLGLRSPHEHPRRRRGRAPPR
jgi:hypothetical protein